MSTSSDRPRNDGSESERIFAEKILMAYGKEAYLYKMTDTKQIKGMMGKSGFAKAAPSDFVLTVRGHMGFVEIKSTSHPTSFSLDCFTPSQNVGMVRQKSAWGRYDVYVHHLVTDSWYAINTTIIEMWREAKFKSIKWKDMEQFRWKL